MKTMTTLLTALIVATSAIAYADTPRDFKQLKVERIANGDVLVTIPYTDQMDPKTGQVWSGTVTKNLMDKDRIVKVNGEDVVEANHVCKYKLPNLTECKPRLIPWCKQHKKVMSKNGKKIPPCNDLCRTKLEWKEDKNPPPFIHHKPEQDLPRKICSGNILGTTYWMKIYSEEYTYYEPNMFNGTYIVNGERVDVDIYQQKIDYRMVFVDPINSLRGDVIALYAKNTNWYMFKDANGQWKCHTGRNFTVPEPDIVRFALMGEKTLGINPTGEHFMKIIQKEGCFLGL